MTGTKYITEDKSVEDNQIFLLIHVILPSVVILLVILFFFFISDREKVMCKFAEIPHDSCLDAWLLFFFLTMFS